MQTMRQPCNGPDIRSIIRASFGVDAERKNAGVAQLVERNLAKVEVESSRLFSRSKLHEKGSSGFPFLSEWVSLRRATWNSVAR